jgi:GNAT superfamily N-acetyltransferase
VHAIEVVRVGPEEWREFRTVRLAALIDSPGAFGSRHADWVEADEPRWRARLTDVPFTVIARDDEAPVGVAAGMRAERSVELISMWVAPGHRGTGVAGRLISEVVTWATGLGFRTCLMVRGDNTNAIRAYAHAGFVDHGVPDDWPATAPLERRMWHGGDDPTASP